MAAHDEEDEFEGIDIGGPWGGVRIGSGRARRRADEDDEVRRIRRRVRQRLGVLRHVVIFAIVTGALALADWFTGGGWWVHVLAIIWGGILALQFFSVFVSPLLWGRDLEERLVRREIERRRGRVSVRDGSATGPREDR